MKVGDKVLCKRILGHLPDHFELGKYYYISRVTISSIIVGHPTKRIYRFSHNGFPNYFYSISEVRKMKLEKIEIVSYEER